MCTFDTISFFFKDARTIIVPGNQIEFSEIKILKMDTRYQLK